MKVLSATRSPTVDFTFESLRTLTVNVCIVSERGIGKVANHVWTTVLSI